MGNFLVLAVLAGAVGLAIRTLRKDREKGGCCGNCSACHGGCGQARKND